MKKTQNVREGTRKNASLRKKELALALCVSLWMAGGSIASAGLTTTVTDKNASPGHDVYGNNNGALDHYESHQTTDNTITVQLTEKSLRNVYGAREENNANPIRNNTVNIKSGEMISVYGGYTESNSVAVINNTVNIYGGTIANDVYGGYAKTGLGTSATGNTVNIFGGTIKRQIVGGHKGTVTVENNTLNVAGKGINAGGVQGFENLNFFIPVNMTTADTMLNVTSSYGDNGEANVTSAKIGVMAQGKLANLKTGDKVTLLHATTLTGGNTIQQTTEITVPETIATVNTYEFNITNDTNNIYATITQAPPDDGSDTEAQENTKSVVETKAATTTFINAGADMLASQGFAQAANAVAVEAVESVKNNPQGAPATGGFTPFAAFGGSGMRAESGSYVDTRGFGLNVGFARELSNSQGKLLFGPVVEYGGGSYDSYLDNGTHGEGGSHYFGVGIMARQVNHDGFYYEGSLRGGRVTSDYKGDFNLQTVNYDSASNYFAAHLGLGKAFDMGNNNTLDGYVKYFYSHQAGDDVTMHASITGDENWSFDSVDSHRIRIGTRLTHMINEKNKLYGGLAYQYEFGGEATAHYNGGSTPSPSVKGSSGMLELGWQVKPGEGPLTLDLGVTGWAGKQRGGSVQLGATWSF